MLVGNVFEHQPVPPSCFPGALKEAFLHILEKYSRWEKALDAGSGAGRGGLLPPLGV